MLEHHDFDDPVLATLPGHGGVQADTGFDYFKVFGGGRADAIEGD